MSSSYAGNVRGVRAKAEQFLRRPHGGTAGRNSGPCAALNQAWRRLYTKRSLPCRKGNEEKKAGPCGLPAQFQHAASAGCLFLRNTVPLPHRHRSGTAGTSTRSQQSRNRDPSRGWSQGWEAKERSAGAGRRRPSWR